jgi:hypothetical protein
MTQTLELVTYRTLASVTEKAFQDANAPLAAWLQAQPGFQYRSLSRREDGEWLDMVFWASAETAKAASDAFMEAQKNSAFMAAIDPESVAMSHLPVRIGTPPADAQAA